MKEILALRLVKQLFANEMKRYSRSSGIKIKIYICLLANNKEDYRAKGLIRANIKKDLNREFCKIVYLIQKWI